MATCKSGKKCKGKGKLGSINVKKAKVNHKKASTVKPAKKTTKRPRKEGVAVYGSKEHHAKISKSQKERWARRRRGKGKLGSVNVKKARANHKAVSNSTRHHPNKHVSVTPAQHAVHAESTISRIGHGLHGLLSKIRNKFHG